jgi:hypothetical protein
MKQTCLFVCVLIGCGNNLFGTDLGEVLKRPERFENEKITVVGIARVPGYFYLCPDEKTATDRHPENALLVRKTGKMPEYREMDRQWVEVTGIMSDKEGGGFELGPTRMTNPGILLEHVRELHDRPTPRIKDPSVWAVFKNNTSVPLAIEHTAWSSVGELFFLGPHETQETGIWKGKATASRLDGPSNLPLHEQKIGKTVAKGEITLRSLRRGWQYSRELSPERTLYFRIVGDRIEEVSASEGRRWKIR